MALRSTPRTSWLAPARPALSQHAAIAAFEAYDELDANVARYAEDRGRLLAQLRSIGLDRLVPANGAEIEQAVSITGEWLARQLVR